jgi:hypothetical protein
MPVEPLAERLPALVPAEPLAERLPALAPAEPPLRLPLLPEPPRSMAPEPFDPVPPPLMRAPLPAGAPDIPEELQTHASQCVPSLAHT